MGPKKKGKGKEATKAKEVKEAPTRKKSPLKTSKVQVVQEHLPEIISDTIVEYLHEVEGDSPIDLEWSCFFKIRAVSIEWTNWDTAPNALSLENSAYNVILRGTWPQGMTPGVSKGPLTTKYDFAQAHFHWGPDSNSGSDHNVGGFSLPFEVHLVFYKASSGSLADAKKEEDGVVTFCYLYKISEHDNLSIQSVTDNIKEVTYAHSVKELEPVPLGTLFPAITDDFIAYLGNMKYKTVYGVTFIISRETHFISENQLAGFRNLKDRHENPMILHSREVVSYAGRYVFVMNPKNTNVKSVLLAAPAAAAEKKSLKSSGTSHSSKSSSKKSSTKGKKRSSKKSAKSRKSRKPSKKKSKSAKSRKSRKPSKKKSKSAKSKKSRKPSKKKSKTAGKKKKPSKKPKSKK